jgi:hypothetical protein
MSSGFVQLSDAELQQMDLPSLQAYADQVSTIIGQEFSTIAAAQVVQSQYDYLILSSQSTINGLGNEITTNSNLIISADVRSNELVASNTVLDSNIGSYTSTILGQTKIIESADIQMSSLMVESANIVSSLIQSDKDFASSATYYSSLYTTFVGKDIAYQACITNIINTSTLLSNAIAAQKVSDANWRTSSADTLARTDELNKLYLDSNAIQSTLTQYRINELNAINNLTSTNNSITTLSSLYGTSLLNQQYYQTLSTKTGVLDLYTTAYSAFQTAAALSNASPGNTLVTTAATMAEQRLSTLTTSKKEITDETSKLQTLVAGAVADTYAAQLEEAQAAVQLEINNINTYQAYTNSSIAAVTYFSTLYETANMQVISSLAAVSTFSSFYESSVIGSNTFMKKARDDTASIAIQQSQVDAISYSISSLNIEYEGYTSSYNGWMAYSTLMKKEVDNAKASLITYSSLYESTNTAIAGFNDILRGVDIAINNNNTEIRTQSTILQRETINSLLYDNQVQASFNMEEDAVFKFRETYVRESLQRAQRYYDGCVLAEVQNTSTQNGKLKEQAKESPFTPITININTPTINTANNNVQSISGFLNTFSGIYNNYTTQASNLQNVSTSITAQAASFSNVTSAANAFMTDTTKGAAFSNAQADFISKQLATSRIQNDVALTQTQINNAKVTFMTTYRQVFQSSEIISNETTISSFLIQGFASAVTI